MTYYFWNVPVIIYILKEYVTLQRCHINPQNLKLTAPSSDERRQTQKWDPVKERQYCSLNCAFTNIIPSNFSFFFYNMSINVFTICSPEGLQCIKWRNVSNIWQKRILKKIDAENESLPQYFNVSKKKKEKRRQDRELDSQSDRSKYIHNSI